MYTSVERLLFKRRAKTASHERDKQFTMPSWQEGPGGGSRPGGFASQPKGDTKVGGRSVPIGDRIAGECDNWAINGYCELKGSQKANWRPILQHPPTAKRS